MPQGVDSFVETFLLFKFFNISWPSSVYFYILKKVRVLFKRTSIQLEGNNLGHHPKIKYMYILTIFTCIIVKKLKFTR